MKEQLTSPAKLLYDIEDVMLMLGIGRSKLYSYILSGELASIKLGRRRKITEQAIQDFLHDMATSQSGDRS